MSPAATFELHPDRLFPAEPGTRRLARQLYETVAELPIISPHGHVPPQWLAEDIPFPDPTIICPKLRSLVVWIPRRLIIPN